MTTKEQERKALAQIRKIVEGLGENSYVGTAFEGCFEMAEENIDCDFGNSARWYIEETHRLKEQLKQEQKKHEDELSEWMHSYKKLSDIKSELSVKLEETADRVAAAQKQADEEVKELHLELNNGEEYNGRFSEIRYINRDGFQFITVFEPCGWAVSYKMDDIKSLYID